MYRYAIGLILVLLSAVIPLTLVAEESLSKERVVDPPLTADYHKAILAAQDGPPLATSEKAPQPQLRGTVVDTSGAVIAGAIVQVRSTNGTVLRTTPSDANGSFIISGLVAGNYRLVVSNSGFETKEIPITIRATETPGPLR